MFHLCAEFTYKCIAFQSVTVTAVVQVLGLAVLMIIDKFTLNALAILRFSTEALMMIIRMSMTYKNRKSFTGDKVIEQR